MPERDKGHPRKSMLECYLARNKQRRPIPVRRSGTIRETTQCAAAQRVPRVGDERHNRTRGAMRPHRVGNEPHNESPKHEASRDAADRTWVLASDASRDCRVRSTPGLLHRALGRASFIRATPARADSASWRGDTLLGGLGSIGTHESCDQQRHVEVAGDHLEKRERAGLIRKRGDITVSQ